jgi:hypothetical protein
MRNPMVVEFRSSNSYASYRVSDCVALKYVGLGAAELGTPTAIDLSSATNKDLETFSMEQVLDAVDAVGDGRWA